MSEPLDQSAIEALMAAELDAGVQATAPSDASASSADGGSLSQAEIEAILAGGDIGPAVADAPAIAAAGPGDGLSQAEIEAILDGGVLTAAEPPPPGATSPGAAARQASPVSMPAGPAPVIEDVAFDVLHEMEAPVDRPAGIEVLLDVPLSITVELGSATVTIRDLLDLGQGSILRLDRRAGEPVDVLVNGRRLARGEVVVMEEDFGIRVTDVVSAAERLRSMGE